VGRINKTTENYDETLSHAVYAQRLDRNVHAGQKAAVGLPHGELCVPQIPHAPVWVHR